MLPGQIYSAIFFCHTTTAVPIDVRTGQRRGGGEGEFVSGMEGGGYVL